MQNSCISLLFEYNSSDFKSEEFKNNKSEKKTFKNNPFNTPLSLISNLDRNYNEMNCQNYNLNGNYKKIYFYNDEESSQLNFNTFDIKNFSFKEFEEVNSNNEERNNIKKIKSISNMINKKLLLKKNKYNNYKTKNKKQSELIKAKNKINKENNNIKCQKNINEKSKEENEKIENNNNSLEKSNIIFIFNYN